jgi:hypothetical protein
MLLGELLFSSSDPAYTPVAKRETDRVSITVEVTQISGTSPSLAVTLQHKNFVDDTWGDHSGGSITLTALGTGAKTYSGLKEQIRLKSVMSGTNAWARAFYYDPQWQ